MLESPIVLALGGVFIFAWLQYTIRKQLAEISQIPVMKSQLSTLLAERLADRQSESERRIVALEVKIDQHQAEILRRLDRIERSLDADK